MYTFIHTLMHIHTFYTSSYLSSSFHNHGQNIVKRCLECMQLMPDFKKAATFVLG